jgi:hypothetical protein
MSTDVLFLNVGIIFLEQKEKKKSRAIPQICCDEGIKHGSMQQYGLKGSPSRAERNSWSSHIVWSRQYKSFNNKEFFLGAIPGVNMRAHCCKR